MLFHLALACNIIGTYVIIEIILFIYYARFFFSAPANAWGFATWLSGIFCAFF